MVKFTQRNSYLTGKIDKRYDEGAEGNDEEDGNPSLVLNLKKGAYEGNDHHQRYRDAADYGPEDGPVDHGRTPHQTRKICLEAGLGSVVVSDRVQDDCSIDDPVEARNQHRNKGRQRPEQKCGRRSLRDDLRQLTDRGQLGDHGKSSL